MPSRRFLSPCPARLAARVLRDAFGVELQQRHPQGEPGFRAFALEQAGQGRGTRAGHPGDLRPGHDAKEV